MALYPLCQHGRQPRDAIRHAAGAIERKVSGAVERADHLYLLHIFGGLAYSRLDVAAVIGRDKMKMSQFGREMWEEGRVTADRAAILRVLRARFRTDPPADLAAALDGVEDVGRLEALLDRAATCADLAEFRAGLATGPSA
jgi:hypothetical protein